MKAVKARSVRQEHKRAIARNGLDSTLPAESHSLWAHCSLPYPAVHPNSPHPSRFAIAHNLAGGGGWRHYQHGIHRRFDVPYPRKASAAAQFGGVRVHWNHIVTATAEFVEQASTETGGFAR